MLMIERTKRKCPANVLSVRPVPSYPETGQTGHTPLGVSCCPVRWGTPIESMSGCQSTVERVPPAERAAAGGVERGLSLIANDSQFTMQTVNKNWNGK